MKNASGDAYVVFHNKGTEFTRISATEKDGYVTFKTTHFSIYTIVKYDSKDEATTEKIMLLKKIWVQKKHQKQTMMKVIIMKQLMK